MGRNKIKTRLMVTLLLIISGVFMLFIFILSSNLRQISINQMTDIVESVGKNASVAIRSPLFYSDYSALRNIVEPLAGNNFNYFIVFDMRFNTIAYHTENEATIFPNIFNHLREPSSLTKNKTRSIFQIGAVRYNEFVYPVLLGDIATPLGFVVIGVSQQQIEARFSAITRGLTLLSILTLLVIGVVIYFITGRFIQPLYTLTKTMTSFSAGNYTIRSKLKTGDEIEVLSESFNNIANKINDQISSIENYNRNLEKMVDERTREWVTAMVELREKDTKLEQARKMKSLAELVTSLAHEINNPITIISGNVQLLEKQITDPTLRKRVHIIHTSIERIVTLIRDIAFFMSLRDITLEKCPVDRTIYDVVSETVPDNIKVYYENVSPVFILASRQLLEMAVKHILVNAIDALYTNNEEKQIKIVFIKQMNKLRIEFSDNGKGISDPQRIFEPFFSTHPEKKGLGLTFVYFIMQLHNGEVAAENLSHGARISLTFHQ